MILPTRRHLQWMRSFKLMTYPDYWMAIAQTVGVHRASDIDFPKNLIMKLTSEKNSATWTALKPNTPAFTTGTTKRHLQKRVKQNAKWCNSLNVNSHRNQIYHFAAYAWEYVSDFLLDPESVARCFSSPVSCNTKSLCLMLCISPQSLVVTVDFPLASTYPHFSTGIISHKTTMWGPPVLFVGL